MHSGSSRWCDTSVHRFDRRRDRARPGRGSPRGPWYARPLLVPGHLAHWDDVEPELNELGPLSARWRDLGEAAGSVTVGVQRIDVTPGKRSTPLHVELAEEEIHYVLRGSGLSWQWDGEEHRTYEVRGRRLPHAPHRGGGPHARRRARRARRARVRNARGLGRHVPAARRRRPRPARLGRDARRRHTRGSARPRAEQEKLPAPGERTSRILRRGDVEPREVEHGESSFLEWKLTPEARLTGLRRQEIRPAKRNWPLHCHTAEEEIFVVLAGSGEVRLGDERSSVREGSVVARPAGTGVAHAFYAGDHGLTLLAYGTHDPRDIAWYPEAGKVNFRGFGFTARVEPLDYWEGQG